MCKRLYDLCLERLCPLLENAGAELDWSDALECGPLDNLASRIADDLLERALCNSTRWNDSWIIFLTPKITSAVLKWDKQLIEFVGKKCKVQTSEASSHTTSVPLSVDLSHIKIVEVKQNLRRVMFKWVAAGFDPDLLKALPKSLGSVDFDGELQPTRRCHLPGLGRPSWLPEAEAVFKALSLRSKRALEVGGRPTRLTELHLGTVSVTPEQLVAVLRLAPDIRLLRHYQLVAALYGRHADEWRRDPAAALPRYRLTNLDADFSHVVRCRMSPAAVLAGDALRLAAALCPDASSVRVRVDCATPHDVLAPIAALRKLRELSVVCVTSGERSNLDFSDLVPILEAHGETSLTSLELKVLEEVESHQVVSLCPRLESLVLSGCGFVCPATCASYACASKASSGLRRLKLLFYADGDDFSWTHSVPQCFWKATLATGPAKRSRLTGIFLESPQISEATGREIWPPDGPKPLYPELAVLSLFRCPEITLDQVKAVVRGAPLRYLRASECERLHPKRLRQMCDCASSDLTIHTT